MTGVESISRLEAEMALEELGRREREEKLRYYRPYPFQAKFHELGAANAQVALMAANRVGKTLCASREVAYHLTGLYPDWWEGRRFNGPVKVWAAGDTNTKTRDIVQSELFGDANDPSALGTGAVPKNLIVETVRMPGIPNMFSSVAVRHVSGGNSVLSFKTYQMGATAFMGESLHAIWLDEEPSETIYGQCLARVLDKSGLILFTFTPESGVTEVVRRFLHGRSDGQALVTATWEDAPHLDEAAKKQILEALPEHERKMRSQGIPSLGSGMVFPIEESAITCKPFELPGHWARIAGIDFGLDHDTAVVWIAWDRETDTCVVYDIYHSNEQLISTHASAMKARGEDVLVAWPHDGHRRDSGSGVGLAEQYRREGVRMAFTHFTNPPTVGQIEGQGGNSVEVGIGAMYSAMREGRFKVFDHLVDWFQEFRLYHRKDGMIVKKHDDLMSATRYAYMFRRHAGGTTPERLQRKAISDYDPFGG